MTETDIGKPGSGSDGGNARFVSSLRFLAAKALFICCIFFHAADAGGNTEADNFRTDQFKTMEYRIFKPGNLVEGDRVPLIVGLHGRGKREVDISKILMNFHVIASTPEFQEQYPCYVLAPKTTKSWFPREIEDPGLTPGQIAELPPVWRNEYEETIRQINNPPKGGFGELEILLELIDKVVAENAIDPARIYVLGFSMGGMGTWQALAARPGFFAAAIPVAGGRLWPWQWNPELMKVPIWAFHGTEDKTTVPERHQSIFNYARSIRGNMKYTEFKGANHQIIEYVFTPSGEIHYEGDIHTASAGDSCDDEANVWKWLFRQRKVTEK